ncbi:MAG TPA: class I SAM-dependent methyltransferase [Candidatus Cryptobacteroides sp.]|nr:class I SAM-dependent methyltransferase [Candidatus Cryptobacteroides sp.]
MMNIKMEKYSLAISLWKEWNSKINVISRKDADAIFEHHILHSLSIAEYIRRHYGTLEAAAGRNGNADAASISGTATTSLTGKSAALENGSAATLENGSAVATSLSGNNILPASEKASTFRPSILDLGTGGGFPGIPLAMEWPEVQFTLCDSIGKKIKVAQAVSDGLGLKNVSCIQARAEDLQGGWDFVVSRAVAPLDTLYSWVGAKFHRSLICLKGGDVNEEIAILLKRFKLSPKQIRTWRISDWLEDEYFAEKFVIEVGKSEF